MKSIRTLTPFTLSLILLTSIAAAQEETTELPTVKVKAAEESMTAPGVESAEEAIRSVPGGASVQDSKEYRKGRVSTIKDALEFAPGVFVQPRYGAEEARLSIRGSGIQRTFHGRGIRLLQDGVPLNLADGSFDFQAVEPLSAQYIEVYRGANALRYGATTLGGAINFVSMTGRDASPLTARLEGGSFHLWRGQLASGATFGDTDVFGSLTQFSQEGFRVHSKQNTQRFFGNAGRKLSPDLETRLFVTWVNTNSEIPGNLTPAQLEADPTQAQRNAAAPQFDNVLSNWQRNFSLLRLADRTTYRLSEGSVLDGSIYWSRKHLDHPILIVIDQLSNDFGLNLKWSHESTGDAADSFTVGINPEIGTLHDIRYQNNLGSRGTQLSDSQQTSTNLALYSEWQRRLVSSFYSVVGLQMAYSIRKNEDLFPVTASDPDNSDRQSYFGWMPKVGARYDVTEHTQAYVNVSRSFEPPSFGELVPVTGQGGLLQLDPQQATTLELGSRGAEWRLSWDASYYYSWVSRELIGYQTTPGASTTLNADRTIHQGIELGVGIGFLKSVGRKRDGSALYPLVFRQGFLWNDFRFSGDSSYGDNRLAGIPQNIYKAELTFEGSEGYYLGPNLERVFSPYPVDFANTLFANNYTLFGFKAGWNFKNGLSAFVDARNLTDEKYAATTSVITRATATNQAQLLSGDGRSVFGGIQWRM